MRIEIGERNYLLYLLLPHHRKMALLSAASRERLERINRRFNETVYSGDGAADYDRIHRYAGEEQHEYPAEMLVTRVWAPEGYGHALELGAGTGYFTVPLARRAQSVVAVEPVPDMRDVLRRRCADAGLDNVRVLDVSAATLSDRLPAGAVDSAVIIQSLHHFHRRADVFEALGRVVRPGGRLFVLEPHHNLRRAARLLRKYWTDYRKAGAWRDERQWATHDFLTCGELRALCRHGGFHDVRISRFWFPFSRRLVPDPARRFALEHVLSRVPVARHFAGVLAVEARRHSGTPSR
jgi:ubiquinone/menaquinone biosynthesis C-methylase UbiE